MRAVKNEKPEGLTHPGLLRLGQTENGCVGLSGLAPQLELTGAFDPGRGYASLSGFNPVNIWNKILTFIVVNWRSSQTRLEIVKKRRAISKVVQTG